MTTPLVPKKKAGKWPTPSRTNTDRQQYDHPSEAEKKERKKRITLPKVSILDDKDDK